MGLYSLNLKTKKLKNSKTKSRKAVYLYVGKTIKKSQMFYDFFGKNKECISERGMKNETDSDNMIYNISFG